ncbi:P27 family phage terminase small subunit [Bacillus toyonensis]|uniref:P27 family phage terminase small subunit n=1 Tax=Bacillus toyonensis TaxID=155322 RepID=UPI0020D28226|nr:P27 family phage terminase small subunit [Bacillus toyonensis]
MKEYKTKQQKRKFYDSGEWKSTREQVKKRETMRKRIEKDLINQLKEKKIVGNHYVDLIQDYLSLWDLKCILVDDIEETGIKVSGMHGPKSNPSINDLHKTNDRMIKILDALGLEALAEETKVPSKPVRSARDLT